MADGIAAIKLVVDGNTSYFGSASNTKVLLETKFFDLDGYTMLQQPIGNLEKTLTGILFEIGDGIIDTVSLYVGVKQRLIDTPVWYGPYSVAEGDDMIHLLDVEDARHFAFRIVDLQPVSIWSMSAMEIYGIVRQGRV